METESSNLDPNLERLYRIVEEIPSGVSEDVLQSTIVQIRNSEEIISITRDYIISNTKLFLNNFWQDFNVSVKIKRLKELEEKSNKENAWRPTTGEAPISAKMLREMKNKLEDEIKSTREETERVKAYLQQNMKKLQKQLVEMETFEFPNVASSTIEYEH
ncbi:uncharacterized protein [Diabrotica undecimpunctata]|uniref:uncharacterized protein n=1 Tax=Diabrotica undecimpunctata TaxID=50387 RepID=UPI003B63C6B0